MIGVVLAAPKAAWVAQADEAFIAANKPFGRQDVRPPRAHSPTSAHNFSRLNKRDYNLNRKKEKGIASASTVANIIEHTARVREKPKRKNNSAKVYRSNNRFVNL